ncbi:MAG: EamA family transporter, partial [Clostridia bacterium]|nr:EamA family transporter [Clostridia bacterium]
MTAVLPFGLYTYALVHIKPDVASLLATSEPITATIFGATVLAQKLDIFQIVGILLVIGAISSLNISFKSKRK